MGGWGLKLFYQAINYARLDPICALRWLQGGIAIMCSHGGAMLPYRDRRVELCCHIGIAGLFVPTIEQQRNRVIHCKHLS